MGFAAQLREVIAQMPNLPPETRETFRSMLSSAGETGIIFIFLAGLFKLVLYALMAMLGGAIGVALFEKRKPGMDSAGPQPPTQIPPVPPAEV